jgi:hypothetical protein
MDRSIANQVANLAEQVTLRQLGGLLERQLTGTQSSADMGTSSSS